jgi:hypothetical protein
VEDRTLVADRKDILLCIQAALYPLFEFGLNDQLFH